MPWATEAEFKNYLKAAGLIDIDLTATQALLDFQGALDSAVTAWNEITGYWPFLSTGVDEERKFVADPFASTLDLAGGIVAVTSVYTDVTYNSAGTLQTNGLNYRFLPKDAPQKKKPWTYVEFFTRPRNLDNGEVAITGKWGYCLDADLPDAAVRAVLALAALELLPQIKEAVSGGLVRWTEGDRTKQFAELDAAGKGWDSTIERALKAIPRRIRIA